MANNKKLISLEGLLRFKNKLQDFGHETLSFDTIFHTVQSDELRAIYERTSTHINRPIVWMDHDVPVLVDAAFTSASVITYTCITRGTYCAWSIDSTGRCTQIATYLPLPAVIDDLTTTDTTKALSAAQGKYLKDLIDDLAVEAKDLLFDSVPTKGSGHVVTSGGLYNVFLGVTTDLRHIKDVLEDNVLTMEVDETGALNVTTGSASGLDALNSGIDPVTGMIKLVYNIA